MTNFRRQRAQRLLQATAAVLVAAGLLAAASAARAEVHDVTVNSNFFAPNDLSIQQGDTVRWTYEGSPGSGCGPYGACGPGEGEGAAHSVASDDGSFGSGAPASSFVFEHVFDEAGEYRYHCEQHSQPGQDIDTFMNGRIVVESSHNQPSFRINAGLNDAWFDPETAGQGFFVTVFPDIGQMFVAWFTYDVERPPDSVTAELGDAGHRWITAFGPYADDQAVLDIEITTGGVFDAAQPEPVQHLDGTLTLEFTGCDAGTVSYDIPSLGLQGNVPIQRIAGDNLPLCEAAN